MGKIMEERTKICDACENSFLGICKKCGCVIALKIRLPNTECPIGKW